MSESWPVGLLFFLFFFHENLCCGYSLEALCCRAFSEDHQNVDKDNRKEKQLSGYGKCPKISYTKVADIMGYANSADPDQTAPGGAV